MDKRDDTRQEVLLDVREEPIASFDELVERCHRALSAQLWTTCCWSENGSGWKIGDFNYLVVSVEPDEDTSLFVQFWSEPGEGVLTEVSSGECYPGAIRYIGPAQREALIARGYTLGGNVRNYQRESVIDSPAAAEAAALEVLQIFFEVFGYRGQWRLEVERHHGERAEHDPVHTSVTRESRDPCRVEGDGHEERRRADRGADAPAACFPGAHGLARIRAESLFARRLAGRVDAEAAGVGRGNLVGQFEFEVGQGLAHRRAHGPHAHAARAQWRRDRGLAGAVAAALDEQLARVRATVPARRRADDASRGMAAHRARSLTGG